MCEIEGGGGCQKSQAQIPVRGTGTPTVRTCPIGFPFPFQVSTQGNQNASPHFETKGFFFFIFSGMICASTDKAGKVGYEQ